MEHPTVRDVVGLLYNIISKHNPVLRFYQHSASRPAPVEPFLHQVEILARCMLRSRVRILVGDEIGLGKTITAIAVGRYLKDVGLARRILVLVPRILVRKWEAEIGYWVDRGVHVVERWNVDNYRDRGFPEGWYIVSMDLFARNKEVRRALLEVNWDLVIVDEAHRLSHSARQRWKHIGRELIARHPERHVILLTATPHKGFPHDYIDKLRILDPQLTSDTDDLDNVEFYRQVWNVLVFRRMKGDVNNVYERREIFKPARLTAVLIRPNDLEAEFFRKIELVLLNIAKKSEHEKRAEGLAKLLAVLLAKRAFSSPVAAYGTLSYIVAKRAELLRRGATVGKAEEKAKELSKRVVRHLAGDYGEEGSVLEDVASAINEFLSYASMLLDENTVMELKELEGLARRIQEGRDSKLGKLVELVRYHLSRGSKVVVFTEYADTAYYVATKLKEVLEGEVAVLTGREAQDRIRMKDVEDGFLRGDRYKVLVSTDVLSEGLDLQVANVLVNYDLPWTPLKLEQRMGRVWRLGQGRECYIYLFVVGSSDRATGASRVVSVLYAKLLNMARALGRVNPILGEDVEVYDKNLSEEERERAIIITGRGFRRGRKAVSESEIILKSLNDREFARFAERYAKAIRSIAERIRASDADPQPSNDIVTSLALTVGFSSQEELRELLLSLARSLAEARGVLRTLGGGKEMVEGAFYQKPLQEMSVRELIDVVSKLGGQLTTPIRIVMGGDAEQKVYMFKVKVFLDGVERLVDVLGVSENPLKVMSVVEILKLLLPAFRRFHFVSRADDSELNNVKAWATSVLREHLWGTIMFKDLEGVKRYVETLAKRGLRGGSRIEQPQIEVEPLGVIEVYKPGDVIRRVPHQYLERLVGVYDREKAEVERQAIEILKSKLSDEFNILDVHELGWYFDLMIVGKKGKLGEQRLVEVKSWKHMDPIVILTDNEKWFGENCEKMGFNYWLYTVDMRRGQPVIKGYRNPITSALKLVREIGIGNGTLYVYEVMRKADEEY
jgi:superfamily II DNA or RNA helicase